MSDGLLGRNRGLMATKSRKLELYTFAAHDEGGVVDYVQLFDELESAPRELRNVDQGDSVISLPHLRRRGGQVALVMYEGPRDVLPLIYDMADGTERVEDLTDSEYLATRTHAVLRVTDRLLAVEYNHRGAKARDLEHVVEALAKELLGRQVHVSVNPVADRSFLESIELFERITQASVRVARPNQDWSDWHSELGKLAAESHGQTANVEVNAGRGNSLSEDSGIIELLRSLVRQRRSTVSSARVAGYRSGEKRPTAVSLQRHVTHQRVQAEIGPDGQASQAPMLDNLDAFVSTQEIRERDEPTLDELQS